MTLLHLSGQNPRRLRRRRPPVGWPLVGHDWRRASPRPQALAREGPSQASQPARPRTRRCRTRARSSRSQCLTCLTCYPGSYPSSSSVVPASSSRRKLQLLQLVAERPRRTAPRRGVDCTMLRCVRSPRMIDARSGLSSHSCLCKRRGRVPFVVCRLWGELLQAYYFEGDWRHCRPKPCPLKISSFLWQSSWLQMKQGPSRWRARFDLQRTSPVVSFQLSKTPSY